MTEIPIERVRACWARAAGFPGDKERVYPEHAVAHGFDKHAGADVLEYGCGGGSDTLSWLRRGCQVWALDVTPSNVDTTLVRARKMGLSYSLSALALDQSAPIPLASDGFDVVSCHGVLHHIPDPMPVLREFFRLLKPGGHLYVMLYTETLWKRLLPLTEAGIARGLTREEAFGWGTDEEGCPYAVHYTEAEGVALLASVGFTVLGSLDYNNAEFRTFHAVKP